MSFLTVTVPAPLMQWAKGVKGTTVYCAVVPIESLPSSPKRLIYVACGFDLRFGWHIIAADEEESRAHKDKLPDPSLWHWGIPGIGHDGTALCQQFRIGLDVSSESDLYYVMDSIRSLRPDSLH